MPDDIYAKSISATEIVCLPDENYEYVFTITDGRNNHLVHVSPEVMEQFFVHCFRILRPAFNGFLEKSNLYKEDNPDLLRVLGNHDTSDVLQGILPVRRDQ